MFKTFISFNKLSNKKTMKNNEKTMKNNEKTMKKQ